MSRFSRLEFEQQVVSPAEQAVAPSSQQDEAYHLRAAEMLFQRGDFNEALRAYAKALEYNPKNPRPWTGQVRMLIELEEFREAKLWADKALEMFPHEPELLAAKAVALGRVGDFKAAMAFSDASLSERGESPYLWIARADVLLAQKQDSAGHCLERALAQGPADWLLHWLISRVHAYYERFAQALASAQKGLSLDASRFQLWLQAAICQQHLGLLDAAAGSVGHALKLEPRNPLALRLDADLQVIPPHAIWWRRFRHFFRR